MTGQQPTLQPPNPPESAAPPVQIAPRKGSRLADLHALYATTKAAADEAAAAHQAVVDAIKVELTNAAPGATRIELAGQGGPVLRLVHTVTHRFDSRRFKAVDPDTWAKYLKPSESWTLKAAGGGQ